MDKLLEQSLLYDFYGELLNPHQREIYESFTFDDMSLGEIAQVQGISRQGVHDLVRRCEKSLLEYEEKLHLVERFTLVKAKIAEIERLTKAESDLTADEKMDRIRILSEEIMEDL